MLETTIVSFHLALPMEGNSNSNSSSVDMTDVNRRTDQLHLPCSTIFLPNVMKLPFIVKMMKALNNYVAVPAELFHLFYPSRTSSCIRNQWHL